MPDQGDVDGGVEFGHLDALAESVLIADADGRLTYVNAAAQRLLGLRAELLHGRLIGEVAFTADDQGACREAAGQVLAGVPWLGELDVVHADGLTVHTEVSCAPIRRAGTTTGLLCVLNEL